MRHNVFGNQLGRNTKQAKALYRGLTRELFVHGRIETTLAKAKAIVPMVDRVITMAKKNSVSARREVVKILGSESPLNKIFDEIVPGFSNRNSGFSRIIRLQERFSDTTKLAIIELVERVAVEPKKIEIKDKSDEIKDKQSLRSSRSAGLKKLEMKTKEKPKIVKKTTKPKKVITKKK